MLPNGCFPTPAARLRNRVQLTTDGHKPYLEAVEAAFGSEIDYAMLQKIYGADPGSETRYSPAVCLGCKVEEITGTPNPKHISTSYVERQNLTMRMHMRRFTRLTNAFSKKLENHAATIALYFMYYPPTQDGWATGGREVTCLVFDPEGPLTGSVRGSGR